MRSNYYWHPQEVWDRKRCEKEARHVARDGMGTKYPWPGYVGCSTYPGAYGRTTFNGGCVHDGQWYTGSIRPLPKLAKGFRLARVLSWGWRIIKVERKSSGR